jgi:hypothetical protein
MFRQRTRCISRRSIERPCTKRDEQALSAHRQWRQMVSLNRPPSGTMIATPRRIPSWNDKHQYATRAFGSGDGNMPPREAGEPITDQSMARQLGLAASENKKHLRQRTATIRREQTAKNATNLFRNSNNPNELGFKHLVDIEGVTGSIPVAPTIQSPQTARFQ